MSNTDTIVKLQFYLSNIFYIVVINIMNILLITYYSYNIFQSYLFTLFLSFNIVINSFIFTLSDKDLILTTFTNTLNSIKNNKLTFFIISFPISLLVTLANNIIDYNFGQVIKCNAVVINYILSILINKTKYNWQIILAMLFNIIGCIIPFIINKNIKNSIFGLIGILFLLLINGIVYSYIEKSQIIVDKENTTSSNILLYLIPHTIYLILFIPIIFTVQKYDNVDINIDFKKICEIIFFSEIGSLILVYFKINYFKSVLYLESYEFGLISNISSFMIISINCLLGFATFNYIYILSFFIILISTYVINNMKKKLNNTEIIELNNTD